LFECLILQTLQLENGQCRDVIFLLGDLIWSKFGKFCNVYNKLSDFQKLVWLSDIGLRVVYFLKKYYVSAFFDNYVVGYMSD